MKLNTFEKVGFGLLFISLLLSFATDITGLLQHEDLSLPLWLNSIILGVDVLTLLSLFFILRQKKWAVFLYPFTILTHYILYNFYLSTTLYLDINQLFHFVTIGLLILIPRWKDLN